MLNPQFALRKRVKRFKSQIAQASYIHLVDGLTTLPKGTYYSAVSYRKYFNAGEYFIRHTLSDYMIGQWNVAGTYRIEVPSDLVGRKVEVVERTSNVNVASQITTKALIVNVTDSNASNG